MSLPSHLGRRSGGCRAATIIEGRPGTTRTTRSLVTRVWAPPSGEQEDAFPYFKQLDLEGRLLPTLDDYAALEKDRGRRFVERVMRVVPRLMEQAKEQPEAEQSASIGGSTQIGVAMEVVETLKAVYLRVSPLNLRPARLEIILATVFGDRPWEVTDRFPNREPSVEELRFRSAEV
jgi:hypothetical protein